MDIKKQCSVCKKQFNPCSSCDKLKVFFKDETYQWRKVVCCIEHFYYHLPIIKYARKEIDKDTAKKQLNNAIDKYGEIEFNDNVLNIVEEILSESGINKIETDIMDKIIEVNIESSKNTVNKKKKTR